MKTFILYLRKLWLFAALLVNSLYGYAQPAPDYTFATPVLISGTANQVGAVYRFANVKPGVDAIVTITGAVNATLATLDATGQGWNAAFQPNITIPSMQTGYVEFKIDFVTAGTFTLLTQPQVAVTALDVDGYNYAANIQLYEFEQFDMGADSYVEFDFLGTDIALSFNGTAIRGTNVGGVDYGSINLSPNVRFTVFRSGVTSIIVRSGANNQDQNNNVTRQRSFYFARFTYPNSQIILDASDLVSFNGFAPGKNIVQLNWQLSANHTIHTIAIEHSANGITFETLKTVSANTSGYMDNPAAGTANYYRLQLRDFDGTSFYSKVVKVNAGPDDAGRLQVFPTTGTGNTTVVFNSRQQANATIQLTDYSGKICFLESLPAKEGVNSIDIKPKQQLPAGNYIITVITGNERLTGKMRVIR